MNAGEVASRLGARRTRREWRTNCPSCGYHASFIIRGRPDQRARVSCVSCNDCHGITSALQAITAGSWSPPERRAPETETEIRSAKQRRAAAVWERAGPATGGPAATYLASRGLPELAASPALRFAPSIGHPQGGPMLPAMVARVVDVAGETTGVHRTYLRRDGSGKAAIEPSKASLGTVWGGAIRLHPHDPALPLVVAEGIETAASAGLLATLPAWSAISAGNLGAGLILPEEVRNVLIASDPDTVGRRSAVQAALRWTKEGRTVRVAFPTGAGDWNDALVQEISRG